MRAVIGLLLVFTGGELLYLTLTGKLGNQSGGTGGGPDEVQVRVSQPYAPVAMRGWGHHPVPPHVGGLLP